MSRSAVPIIGEVVEKDLCTGCGTCAGICPTRIIQFKDIEIPIPTITKPESCSECELCIKFCPGHSVDFGAVNKFVFGQKANSALGFYRGIFTGFSKNDEIRQNASAGGVVTSLLLYALEKKNIDGAIVVTANKERPWISEVHIARSKDDIIASMQSKYTIVPVNSILSKISKLKGRYAIVGLPCQIHALRKMEMNGNKLSEKIKYKIGIYCGFSSTFGATKYIIKKMGVSNFDDMSSFEYRGGGWPGGVLIKLKNSKELFLKKFYHNFVIPLYLPTRCTLCIDLTNEFSDMSVGDAWLPEIIKKGEGTSMIVARTKKGMDLVNDAVKAGYLEVQRLQESDAVRAHKHMLNYKQKGAFLRMCFRTMFNKDVPDYGLELPKINEFGYKRLVTEILFVSMLKSLSIRPIRWLVKRLPMTLLGRMALMVRNIVTR